MNKLIYPKEALQFLFMCDCEDIEIDLSELHEDTLDPDSDLEENIEQYSDVVERATESITLLIDTLDSTRAIDVSKLNTLMELVEGNEDFDFRSIDGVIDTIKNHKVEALSYAFTKSIGSLFKAVMKGLKKLSVVISIMNKRSAFTFGKWADYSEKILKTNERILDEIVIGYYPYSSLKSYFKFFEDSVREINFILSNYNNPHDNTIDSRLSSLSKLVNKFSDERLMKSKRVDTIRKLGYDSIRLKVVNEQMKLFLSDNKFNKFMNDINAALRNISKAYKEIAKNAAVDPKVKYKEEELENANLRIKILIKLYIKIIESLNRYLTDTYKLYSSFDKFAESIEY